MSLWHCNGGCRRRQLLPVLWCVLLVGFLVCGGSRAQLSYDFYGASCPKVESIVREQVQRAQSSDPRIVASLTRLFFHDCFVDGCDASILLDNSGSIRSEKDATPNKNSVRGYEVVDEIKAAVEQACPGVVSCADILALAALSSVNLAGGPYWQVALGRRDGVSANPDAANRALPGAADSLFVLQSKFASVGLSPSDLVALSGAHTFGQAQCKFYTDRLYNFAGTNSGDPNLDPSYGASLQQTCPQGGNAAALNYFDASSPYKFDSGYYQNLLSNRGLLQSDQELFSSGDIIAASIVNRFAADENTFFNRFAWSMNKMGSIGVITGSYGQIRKNCRFVNNDH